VFGRISLLTSITFAIACQTPPPKSAAQAEAPPLPQVELHTLDGAPARLSSQVEGRVALVSLWATWCDACVQEIDALGRLDERVRALGGTVVAVDEGESAGTVRAFVRERGLRYAQLIDEELRLGDALGSKRVPTTLVVDRSGRIAYLGGALDEAALAALRAVLSAPAVAAR